MINMPSGAECLPRPTEQVQALREDKASLPARTAHGHPVERKLQVGVGGDHCGFGPVWMSAKTLRKWVRQAEIDAGRAPGLPTESAAELRELRRGGRELEQTVEVLKAATSFFVRESDPLPR
jgi:transposase